MRSRYLLFALVLISLQSFAEAQQIPPPKNLLTNWSNEDPIPTGVINGWHVVPIGSQNWTRRNSNPTAEHGGYYFFPGARPSGEKYTELVQIVDVSQFEKPIKAGKQYFNFTGYMRVYKQTSPDESWIRVEYLTDTKVRIDTLFDSGRRSDTDGWHPVTSGRKLAPAGTTKIRVRLGSFRNEGTNNDGYYDALSLTAEEVVEFTGATSCTTLDSGFDATDTSSPPWLSVAVGQTTQVAKAKITPADRAGAVSFSSDDRATADVSPGTATTAQTFALQTLDVTGNGAETAMINATVNQNRLAALTVAAFPKRTVEVAVYVVSPLKKEGIHPSEGCTPPLTPALMGQLPVTRETLEDGLNKIWDQAAIEFNIVTFEPKTVDFDLNGDCMLELVGDDFTLEQRIIMNAVSPSADIIVYYVHNTTHGDFGAIAYPVSPGQIFVWDTYNSYERTTAHEIGHILLGTGHTIDPNSLMFYGGALPLPDVIPNPCFLNKVEWAVSNLAAANLAIY